MKLVAIALLLLICLISACPVSALVIRADSLTGETGFVLEPGWRYHPGDDPAWANPELDDDAWRAVVGDAVTAPADMAWSGVGWFRLAIEVDTALINRELAISVSQIGAAEIYLDGRLLHKTGTIAADGTVREELYEGMLAIIPVAFDERPRHVIAVRLATGERPNYRFPRLEHAERGGFVLTLAELEKLLQYNRTILFSRVSQHTLAGAAAATIAILHLLLFVFYPRQTGHLYYALFTLCTGVIAYVPMHFVMSTDLYEWTWWARVMQVALVLVSVTGIRFLYAVFYDRLPKWFWLWIGIGAVVTGAAWNGPIQVFFIYTLVVFAEFIRVLVLAVIRRKPFAWLIAAGVVAFIGASAFEMLRDIIRQMMSAHQPGSPDDPIQYYLYGLLVMLILMSVGLALRFARINKDLALKLDEVKRLSAARLEQERRAKEQEMERISLEADNALKATELEEAHKRQKVLDELATTNRELRQTQSQLVQSEKMAALGNLVAGVAHEINTPVGAISSMHDTMVRAVNKLKTDISPDEPPDSKLHRTIKVIEDANDVIQSGSNRVTTIVRRLRSFARLDEAELKKIDIHEGLEDTLTLVHHELKHNVTVHRNYGKIPDIACYPGQLNQVFLNLLVNARQAIDGDGDITITTSRRDSNVVIEFKDTGRGIPKESIDKIFDPGFTTKGVGVGTGLGLSICYRIIQEHKGEILVDSALGKGTTFTIVLPMDLE